MNTYEVSWAETKTTSTGKSYKVLTLLGHEDKKVSIWSDFPDFANVMPGSKLSGELKQNDKGYWNIYPPKPASTGSFGANKGGAVAKAMEKKEASIEKFQVNKELSIKQASTLRMAVDLATAEFEKGGPESPVSLEGRIKYWRQKMWLEWDKTDTDFPPL